MREKTGSKPGPKEVPKRSRRGPKEVRPVVGGAGSEGCATRRGRFSDGSTWDGAEHSNPPSGRYPGASCAWTREQRVAAFVGAHGTYATTNGSIIVDARREVKKDVWVLSGLRRGGDTAAFRTLIRRGAEVVAADGAATDPVAPAAPAESCDAAGRRQQR